MRVKSMRTVIFIVACVAVSSSCARPIKPQPERYAPVAPFADEPVSFVISERRLIPGEVTIVRVCIAADRTISSTNIIESSGDPHFDDMALGWARLIKLRSVPANSAPVQPCGEVRVEIRHSSEPRMLSGSSTSLG
jgi:hypothetical protein